MKANKCPSCGANLNGTEKLCPYCNTSFKSDDTKISIKIIDNTEKKEKPVYTEKTPEEVINELSKLKNNTRRGSFLSALPLVVFAVIAASILMSFGRTMFMFGRWITRFPIIIMVVAVVSTFLGVISRPSQRYLNEVIDDLKDGDIEEAYDFAKSKMQHSNILVGVAVVIAFYIKKDYSFASMYIRKVNGHKFIEFEKHTSLLTNAAFELGYVPPNC